MAAATTQCRLALCPKKLVSFIGGLNTSHACPSRDASRPLTRRQRVGGMVVATEANRMRERHEW